MKSEDEKHCFLKCTWSSSVWDLIMPGNDFLTTVFPFTQWLENQIVTGNPRHRSLLFMGLYSIWLSRNQSTFEGKSPVPSRMATGIIERLDEICVTGISRNLPPIRQTRPGWVRPSPGMLKINFDASFLSQNENSSRGMVARNSNGEVLVAGCFDFGLCLDAKHAEAKAAMKAMDVVLVMGFKNVIFDGDCKVLIDEICTRRMGFDAQDITEVEDLISGFLLSSGGIEYWEMTHSKRETNSLAHHLAARRRTINSDTFYFHPIPVWLANLASSDVNFSGDPS